MDQMNESMGVADAGEVPVEAEQPEDPEPVAPTTAMAAASSPVPIASPVEASPMPVDAEPVAAVENSS